MWLIPPYNNGRTRTRASLSLKNGINTTKMCCFFKFIKGWVMNDCWWICRFNVIPLSFLSACCLCCISCASTVAMLWGKGGQFDVRLTEEELYCEAGLCCCQRGCQRAVPGQDGTQSSSADIVHIGEMLCQSPSDWDFTVCLSLTYIFSHSVLDSDILMLT